MDDNDTEYVLFTSESVGEGHPGDVAIYKIYLTWISLRIYVLKIANN